MRKIIALSAPVFLAILAMAPEAGAASIRRGAALAQENCAACHAVGRHGASPNLKAPTFRRIARQWPPEQLQEALAEGIVTGHGPMPEFVFTTRQIDDFTAYLKRLRRP
jgi:cytochrome c